MSNILFFNVLRAISIGALLTFVAAQFYVIVTDQLVLKRVREVTERAAAMAAATAAASAHSGRLARGLAQVDAVDAALGPAVLADGEWGKGIRSPVGPESAVTAFAGGGGGSGADGDDGEDGGRDGPAAPHTRRQYTTTAYIPGRGAPSSIQGLPSCQGDGYFPGTTIARGGPTNSLFSVLNRILWILFALLLVVCEIDVPPALEASVPMLGPDSSTHWLSFFQFLAATSLLAHRLDMFPFVAALLLLGVSVLNFMAGFYGPELKAVRGFLSERTHKGDGEDDEGDETASVAASIESTVTMNEAYAALGHPPNCDPETLSSLAQEWVTRCINHSHNPCLDAKPYPLSGIADPTIRNLVVQWYEAHMNGGEEEYYDNQEQFEDEYYPSDAGRR